MLREAEVRLSQGEKRSGKICRGPGRSPSRATIAGGAFMAA